MHKKLPHQKLWLSSLPSSGWRLQPSGRRHIRNMAGAELDWRTPSNLNGHRLPGHRQLALYAQ